MKHFLETFFIMLLTFCWFWIAIIKRIASKIFRAGANWNMIYNFALGADSTRSRARILTFFTYASFITWAFWVYSTFWFTIWWCSNIFI